MRPTWTSHSCSSYQSKTCCEERVQIQEAFMCTETLIARTRFGQGKLYACCHTTLGSKTMSSQLTRGLFKHQRNDVPWYWRDQSRRSMANDPVKVYINCCICKLRCLNRVSARSQGLTVGCLYQQGCPLRVVELSMMSSATRKNACSCMRGATQLCISLICICHGISIRVKGLEAHSLAR